MRLFNDETGTSVNISRNDVVELANGETVIVEALDGLGNVWFTLCGNFQCVDFKTVKEVKA